MQCAVGAGAGSYFLKFIYSRGQLATNNCQFLRLARRSSEENQQGRERESAWATPRAHQRRPMLWPTCHLRSFRDKSRSQEEESTVFPRQSDNMKFFAVLALAAVAFAEPEADANADPAVLYGAYGYGLPYASVYGGYSTYGAYPYSYGYYGKRSADAEPAVAPTADAEPAAAPTADAAAYPGADAWYGYYGRPYAYGYGYRPYGYGYYYGKREAAAEAAPSPEAAADPWYGYYGYGLHRPYGYGYYGYRPHGYYYGKRSADVRLR